MEVIKIKELIEEGKNIIFFNKDFESCCKELEVKYKCVYFLSLHQSV